SLRGRVLPIGGVKEKLLAAHQAGIGTVILPSENEANLEEVPEAILSELEVIPVDDFRQVLEVMLVDEANAQAPYVPPGYRPLDPFHASDGSVPVRRLLVAAPEGANAEQRREAEAACVAN